METPKEILDRYDEAERLWAKRPAIIAALKRQAAQMETELAALQYWIEEGKKKAKEIA